MQKLVKQNTERPNVCLGAVVVVNQALRTHVNGTPDGNVAENGFGSDRKSKISHFVTALFHKNVRQLYISMYDKIPV